MVLRLLIDAVHPDETRIVIADNSRIHDFDFVTAAKKQVKGNIYLAKITRVEPSLQAAFVEYGSGKQGFLPFAEIHPDYYQIPMADRRRLLEEAEREHEADDASPQEPSIHDAAPAERLQEHPVADAAPAERLQEHPVADAAWAHSESDAAAPQEILPLPETLMAAPALQDVTSAYSEPMEPFQEKPADALHESSPQDGLQAFVAASESLLSSEKHIADEPQFDTASHAISDNASGDEQADTTSDGGSEQAEHSEAHEVETLGSEEEAMRESRPGSYSRRYKIQEVIKRNQIVLVQVIKEERGNKGVSLTTFISLAGRYCVLMPNSPKGGGISRKIMSGEDRRRLKEISAELKTARGMSAIIRTAGIDRTRAEIKRDYEYLVRLWESIREQTLSSTAPALIYEEGDLIKRTIRDLFSSEIEEIVVEGEEGFAQAKDFMKTILASSAPRVKLHQDNMPLFYAYNIEDQLASMYDPIVKLRSGGYIVINPTEALISIDVNSGRMTGERNIEETATKTNLEAVAEIARQLRLRDLAGLIVIDLIDMMDSRNRRSVERALRDALKLDRAKIQLGRISPFGLLEMSRQRLRPSISETSSMPCPHCQGKGLIRSDASVAIQVVRAMEKEAAGGFLSEIRLTVPPTVALHLLNARRDVISALEQKYGMRVVIQTDNALPIGQFRLEKIKGQNKRGNANPPPVSSVERMELEEEPMEAIPFQQDNQAPLAGSEPFEGNAAGSPESEEAAREDRSRRRGRRGGRGRRPGGPNRFEQNAENATGAQGPEMVLSDPAALDNAASPDAAQGMNDNRPPRADRGERGDRGPRRRRGGNGRYRDRRDRNAAPGAEQGGEMQANAPESQQRNDYAAQPQFNSGSPAQESYTPQPREAYSRQDQPPAGESPPVQSFQPSLPPVNYAPAPIPPLSEQASADAKPKKGWWRRIVES